MEARIARLESDVAHLRTDVADIKIDLRSLRDKIDAMYAKRTYATVGIAPDQRPPTRLPDSFDKLDESVQGLIDDIASMKKWGLVLYFVFAVTMLGTLARGFGWI